MQEIAFAKINLALHVRERRPDGYHRIETLFAFAEDGDRLSVSACDRLELQITGPFAPSLNGEADNLVMTAARALQSRFGTAKGARLELDKRLPVASGIGGGSADAAAALRLLVRWWALDPDPEDIRRIAARLGADVPACLDSRTSRGEGVGDRLTSIDEGLSGHPILLVNPGRPLATSAVFAAWDGIDRGALDDWRDGRNDLERPALALVPEIATVLDALDGADLFRMSGSGATCFGLFADTAIRDRATERIRTDHPDWWIMATRLR